MHIPLRELLPYRFKKLSGQIRRLALSRGKIPKSEAGKNPDFFAQHFDDVGRIEELRDVIRCLAALNISTNGGTDGLPQAEIRRPQNRPPEQL